MPTASQSHEAVCVLLIYIPVIIIDFISIYNVGAESNPNPHYIA